MTPNELQQHKTNAAAGAYGYYSPLIGQLIVDIEYLRQGEKQASATIAALRSELKFMQAALKLAQDENERVQGMLEKLAGYTGGE